jgi:hypothetical protein
VTSEQRILYRRATSRRIHDQRGGGFVSAEQRIIELEAELARVRVERDGAVADVRRLNNAVLWYLAYPTLAGRRDSLDHVLGEMALRRGL